MNKKLLVLFLALIATVSAAYAVVIPAKSVVNPVTQTLYVPDNGSSPAKIHVYKRDESAQIQPGWVEDTARAVSAPSSTAKIFGMAMAPNGSALYVSIANLNYSRLMIYPLDAQGNPGVGVSANWTGDADSSPAGICLVGNTIYMADPGDGQVHIFTYQGGAWNKTGDINLTDSQGYMLSGLSDVAATTPVNGAYKLFVSRKVNSSDTQELFMYTVSASGAINQTSSADLQFPTYMKVYGNSLYVAVNGNDGADIKIFDISGNTLSATGTITNNSGVTGAYGWTGFDISPNGILFYTQAQDSQEQNSKYYRIALPVSGTGVAAAVSGIFKSDGLVVSPDGARLAMTNSATGSKVSLGDTSLSFLVPTFTGITPNSSTYGQPVTVTITGSNFINSPVIQTQPVLSDSYHGTTVNYTLTNVVYNSPTQMTATVNPSGAWKASLYDLSITNKDIDGLSPNNSTYYTSPTHNYTINFTAPQGLQGFATDASGNPLAGGSIRWTWTPNNQGEAYYDLIDNSGNTVKSEIAAGSSTVTEQSLPSNTQYTRRLKAYLQVGLNAVGSAVSRYTAAAAPSLNDLTVTPTQISVTWSTSNPSGTTYKIYRKVGTGAYALATTTTALSYTDTSVTTGTTYTYKATAVNGDGVASAYSNEKSATVPAAPQAPNDPTSFQQFKADGVTAIANGGSAGGTSVVLKATVTGSANPQTIIPFVRIDGGNYIPMTPNTITYTGSPVTVSWAVNNLAAGAHNWDVQLLDANNQTLQTAWVSSGLTFTVPAIAPSVTSITPNGGTQGQTLNSVLVGGNGFASGATVTLTSGTQTMSLNVTNVTSSIITGSLAIPLDKPAGAYTVKVTNTDGQSSTQNVVFTVTAATTPVVSSITPNSTSEGFTILDAFINGSGFDAGATAKLTRTGAPDINVDLPAVTATRINGAITVPLDQPVGAYDVVVTNPSGLQGKLPGGFTVNPKFPAPTLTSIDPNNAVAGGDVKIINLVGTGFLGGATVKLTNASGVKIADATYVSVFSSSYISCKFAIPAGTPAGRYNVVLTNPDTQTAKLTNGFTVFAPGTAPTVTKITPNSGGTGETVTVTIEGTLFNNNPNTTAKIAMTGQQDLPIAIESISAASITGTLVIPNGATTGLWTVLVTNPDNQTGELVDSFTVKMGNGNPTSEPVSSINIVRTADTVGSSVTVTWQTNPANLACDVYTLTGTFSATAANWTKSASNISTGTYTDDNQVGTGTSKYYKVVPTTVSLTDLSLTKEVAGKFDLAVGPSDTQPERALISVPLQTSTTEIASVLGAQPQENDAIAVIDNNFAIVSGMVYTGGAWQEISGSPNLNHLDQGYAFVYTTLNPKYMTIVGKVREAANARAIAGGQDQGQAKLSWIANALPYPVAVSDAKAGLNGLSYGADATVGAQTALIDANAAIIGSDYALHNAAETWVDSNNAASAMVLLPGRGYMLTEPTITNYSWTQSR